MIKESKGACPISLVHILNQSNVALDIMIALISLKYKKQKQTHVCISAK